MNMSSRLSSSHVWNWPQKPIKSHQRINKILEMFAGTEWLHLDAWGNFFQVQQVREGWRRRRSCSGSEGQSHVRMTWGGKSRNTFKGGEELKGEKGGLKCPDHFLPLRITVNMVTVRKGPSDQKKNNCFAKEVVKCCDRAPFDKCLNTLPCIWQLWI